MKRRRYYFYLNPHDEYKWTKCPKCEQKTKVRKHCLMVHYKESFLGTKHLISLNKTCKFCTSCELIIVQKSEIENYIKYFLIQFEVEFKPTNYLVFGTLDKVLWEQNLSLSKVLSSIYRFKNTWDFDIQRAGWYYAGK